MEEIQHNTSKDASSIDGWTKEEKFYLLQGLKVFGSYDIERIHHYITSKSPEQIIMAINHYKKIASEHAVFAKSEKAHKKFCKPRVPLTRWAKLLTDNISLDELKTETPTAVRLIAELETIPAPVSTENIDFRKVYHTIANAMEGKALAPDKNTIALLNKCIIETALASKAFIKTSSYKYVLNSINLSDRESHTFPKPTENQELTILRHLASQRSYNPLKVPEGFMKPCSDAHEQ